jgi:hypothetical protein
MDPAANRRSETIPGTTLRIASSSCTPRDLRSPADGNPSVFVDRKNQMTTSTYDGLDRLTQVQFNDLSTIN